MGSVNCEHVSNLVKHEIHKRFVKIGKDIWEFHTNRYMHIV